MNKTLAILLVLLLTLGVATFVVSADASGINITVDHQQVAFNDDMGYPYFDEHSRTMVPLRATFEAAGATVGYDATTMTAIVILPGHRIEVPIGTNEIYNNGTLTYNDTEAVTRNNRTYLPIRAVLEAGEYEVNWQKAVDGTHLITASSPAFRDFLNTNGSAEGYVISPVNYTGADLNTAAYNHHVILHDWTTVYITGSGKSYHRTPDCSNMKNPLTVTYQEALSLGLTQCPKCW